MARKSLPKNLSAKQLQTIQTVNRSAAAGHAMIKRNPPKVSVRKWIGSKLGLGPPKAETDRQKKIRDALESAKGASKRTARPTARRPARRATGRARGR